MLKKGLFLFDTRYISPSEFLELFASDLEHEYYFDKNSLSVSKNKAGTKDISNYVSSREFQSMIDNFKIYNSRLTLLGSTQKVRKTRISAKSGDFIEFKNKNNYRDIPIRYNKKPLSQKEISTYSNFVSEVNNAYNNGNKRVFIKPSLVITLTNLTNEKIKEKAPELVIMKHPYDFITFQNKISSKKIYNILIRRNKEVAEMIP